MKKQLPLYKPPALPKLTVRAIDLFSSRELQPRERKALLSMLEPDRPINDRCAAAFLSAKLGMKEAGLAMERMIREGQAKNCLKERFILSIGALSEMERHGELPHPEEHLAILMRARNSDEPRERAFADLVLHSADIKFGTPVPDFAAFKADPDYGFRDEARKLASWTGIPRLKAVPKKEPAAKTGSGNE